MSIDLGERLIDIINFLPDATFVIDCSGVVIAWNQAMEEMTGVKAAEILGKGDRVYAIPFYGKPRPILIDLVLNFDEQIASEYALIRQGTDGLVGEMTATVLCGREANLWGKATLLTDTNGQPIGAIESIRDLTERKQMDREMARMEQLNLIGEMAAGLAHEIRNPLTAVRGFAQLLGSKSEFASFREYFDLIIEETDRANLIIKEYLSLAKEKTINLKVQSLNKVVQGIMPLLASEAMLSDKYLYTELGEIPDVLLDEKEMRQLIMNIAKNGLEAMEAGGQMRISTFVDRERVVLSIEDQGKGIDPNLLEKIWTPFFTTKDQGTGLGLAVCASIATRHRATMEVKTGPQGTNFQICFQSVPMVKP